MGESIREQEGLTFHCLEQSPKQAGESTEMQEKILLLNKIRKLSLDALTLCRPATCQTSFERMAHGLASAEGQAMATPFSFTAGVSLGTTANFKSWLTGCENVTHSVMSSCLETPWTIASQAPLSMGFPRQEDWSGLSCPSSGDLPDPGIEPGSPVLQADSLASEPPGKP